jgi:basic amino acid/polyamine antiporter, APA family
MSKPFETKVQDSNIVSKNGAQSGQAVAEPQPALSMFDAVALIVGIVVGAGIFSFPSLVAANSASTTTFLLLWAVGGVVSLIGAMCYAELATTFPSAGGDYHFLKRAFGGRLAFLFAWARMSVIQTGSVALLAFIFGGYATQLYSLGEFSSMIYAALVIAVLTIINIIGIQFGAGTQKLLTTLQILGIVTILIAGFFFAPAQAAATAAAADYAPPAVSAFGMAMVFVLLTFGGWNEAAYISAEMRRGSRQIARALILSIFIITTLYLLINLAYLNALGLGGVATAPETAVAGYLMRLTFGETGAWLISLLVAIAALTSANATIFTGARTNYALGRDFAVFAPLGRWNAQADAPINAFIVQGAISLALVGLGMWTREGIQTIVDYITPVFWFFLFLVGISVFILRRKYPNAERPFRVPLYPLTPVIFCLTCLYLLYSSLTYALSDENKRWGAFVGIGVLLVGVLLLLASPTIEGFLKTNQTRREENEVSTL